LQIIKEKQIMDYSFKIQVGDWSGDGHGQCMDYIFKSNKPVEEIREIYFTAKEKYPTLSPDSFCSDYQDYTIPDEVVKQAEELGYEIDPENFFTDDMAKYTAWFIMLGDSELKLEETKAVETLAFYGYDEKNRHINFIGYGLF
jgi:hypothetical protein